MKKIHIEVSNKRLPIEPTHQDFLELKSRLNYHYNAKWANQFTDVLEYAIDDSVPIELMVALIPNGVIVDEPKKKPNIDLRKTPIVYTKTKLLSDRIISFQLSKKSMFNYNRDGHYFIPNELSNVGCFDYLYIHIKTISESIKPKGSFNKKHDKNGLPFIYNQNQVTNRYETDEHMSSSEFLGLDFDGGDDRKTIESLFNKFKFISFNSFSNNLGNKKENRNRFRLIILLDRAYSRTEILLVKKVLIKKYKKNGLDNASFADNRKMYLPLEYYGKRPSNLKINRNGIAMGLDDILIKNKSKAAVKVSNSYVIDSNEINKFRQSKKIEMAETELNKTGPNTNYTHQGLYKAALILVSAGLNKSNIHNKLNEYAYNNTHQRNLEKQIDTAIAYGDIDPWIFRYQDVDGCIKDTKLNRFKNPYTDEWVLRKDKINNHSALKLKYMLMNGKPFNYKLLLENLNYNQEHYQIAIVLLNNLIYYNQYLDRIYGKQIIEKIKGRLKTDSINYPHFTITNIDKDGRITKTQNTHAKGRWIGKKLKRISNFFNRTDIKDNVTDVTLDNVLNTIYYEKAISPLKVLSELYYIHLTFDTFIKGDFWGKSYCIKASDLLTFSKSDKRVLIQNKKAKVINKILFSNDNNNS